MKLKETDKRGSAYSGRVLVETLESRRSFVVSGPVEPKMIVTFLIPPDLRPYRFIVMGRPAFIPDPKAHPLDTYYQHQSHEYQNPWIVLTPTPLKVTDWNHADMRGPRVQIERPVDEEMDYLVAWVVE